MSALKDLYKHYEAYEASNNNLCNIIKILIIVLKNKNTSFMITL